jgi:hypothetical protein
LLPVALGYWTAGIASIVELDWGSLIHQDRVSVSCCTGEHLCS